MMMTFVTCFGSRLKIRSKKNLDKQQQKLTTFEYSISTPTLPITSHHNGNHDDIVTTATTTNDIQFINNHLSQINLNNNHHHDDDITIINQPFTISPSSSVISLTLNKLKSSIISPYILNHHHHLNHSNNNNNNNSKNNNNIPKKSNSSSSSTSLPQSLSTTTTTTTITKIDPLPPPPCYFDDVILKLPTSTSHHKIEPREEEGNEDLPPYECTVFKMGYMFIKHEFESPTKKAKNRTWRKVYLVIWGTTISAYKSIPSQYNHTEDDENNKDEDDNKKIIKKEKYHDEDDDNDNDNDLDQEVKEIKKTLPLSKNQNKKKIKKQLWCYSMQDAEAGSAHDYRKKKHAIRLRLHKGPQLLISTMSEEEQLLWIEHLQASINVSVDLDNRKMPQFITSNRRRRRRGRLYHDPNHQTSSRYREGSLI